MGISEGRGGDLTVLAAEDGAVTVDVGTRFVAVNDEELERMLDNLAADGGTLRLLGGTGRADDGDEPPDHEADPAMGAAGWVLALAQARGISVVRET